MVEAGEEVAVAIVGGSFLHLGCGKNIFVATSIQELCGYPDCLART
jgi:hypothetical protein